MERQGEAAASDRAETGTDADDERATDDTGPDDGDGSGDAEEPHRMVEAGVGADVPLDDGEEADDAGDDAGGAEAATAEPDGGAPSSEPQGDSSETADGPASPTDGGETRPDGESSADEPDDAEPATADVATASDDPDADAEGGVPPELRDLLAEDGESDDGAPDADTGDTSADDDGDDADRSGTATGDSPSADRETATERSAGGSARERTPDRTSERDRGSGPDRARRSESDSARSSAGRTEAGADAHRVREHRPAEPTELTRPDDASRIATPEPEEESEPAAEAEPVSVRSEMSPALAERQAFVALLVALGAGGLFATLGNVLRLTRWQTLMVLVTAGIVVLLIATFVVFRAMLAAAERNDEPYRTAYTHPLFMFLFILTTTVTALFVGYVSRLVT